ncbi:MAG: hypothetical protein L6E13_06520 [Firmicutes bacterium]|nr:hypothetical protein [Bacillota bacterium]
MAMRLRCLGRLTAAQGVWLRCLTRLVAAQGVWLRRPPVLAATAALVALPPVLAAWHARMQTGSLYNQLLDFDERWLPLWILVAGPVAWGDGEPPHRPLLLSWPAGRAGAALAKASALLGCFALLCLLAGWGLPPLYIWATGAPATLLSEGTPPFTFPLLFSRPLAVGTLLLGLVFVAGAAGAPWAGVASGVLLWIGNNMAPGAWADRFLGGALNLFAMTGDTAHGLAAVTGRTLAAGLTLIALAAVALEGSRMDRWARLLRWHLPFLRHPAVFLTGAGLGTLPVLLLLLYWDGRLSPLHLADGFREFHRRFLPLLALAAGAALWADAEAPHRPALRAWPVTGGQVVASKSLVAAAAFLAVAAGAAGITSATLRHIAERLPPEAPPLAPYLPSAGELFLLSLTPAALLLGFVALGGARGGPWAGALLGTAWWLVETLAGDRAGAALGQALALLTRAWRQVFCR